MIMTVKKLMNHEQKFEKNGLDASFLNHSHGFWSVLNTVILYCLVIAIMHMSCLNLWRWWRWSHQLLHSWVRCLAKSRLKITPISPCNRTTIQNKTIKWWKMNGLMQHDSSIIIAVLFQLRLEYKGGNGRD